MISDKDHNHILCLSKFLKDNVVTGLSGYCACPVENPGKCGIKKYICTCVLFFWLDDWPFAPGMQRAVPVFLSPSMISAIQESCICDNNVVLLSAIPNGQCRTYLNLKLKTETIK